MVEAYHRPWREPGDRGRRRFSGVIPKYMDDFVKEFKTAGSFLDVVQARRMRLQLRTDPDAILDPDEARVAADQPPAAAVIGSCSEPRDAGDVAALDTLISSSCAGVACRRSSGSRSRPGHGSRAAGLADRMGSVERHRVPAFSTRSGICDKRVDANFGAGHGALSAVVSSHFRGVIKKATREASLFRQTWNVREPGRPRRLVYEGELRSALLLRDDNGSAHGEQGAPGSAACRPTRCCPRIVGDTTLRAWVFGKILNWSVEHGALSLHVKPIAILKDDADQQ